MTRADYLEEVIKDNVLLSITRNDPKKPCITRFEEHLTQQDFVVAERVAIALSPKAALESLRECILLELTLGKQSAGYKAAQKALNRFIAELNSLK